jgi:hypothetical protein
MTTYLVDKSRFVGDYQVINAVTPQGERPVLSLTGPASLATAELAANVADALNGAKPRHDIPVSCLLAGWNSRMNGQQIRSGIELFIRENEAHGADRRVSLNVMGEDPVAVETLAKLREGKAAASVLKSLRPQQAAAKPASGPAQRR